MKPLLDISNKNNFTVWESCVWRQDFSSSVLVADQDSKQMQVIYEKNPARNSTHALFYANVSNVLAGCFISKPRRGSTTSKINIELVRIESLTTKTIQGNTVPQAKLTPLYLTSASGVINFDVEPEAAALDELLKGYIDQPSLPNAREMMRQAIIKAMTPPDKQKVFWGLPRQKVEQDY